MKNKERILFGIFVTFVITIQVVVFISMAKECQDLKTENAQLKQQINRVTDK